MSAFGRFTEGVHAGGLLARLLVFVGAFVVLCLVFPLGIQSVIPVNGIIRNGDYTTLVVREAPAVTMACIWWLAAGVAFGWLFRRYSLRGSVIAAVPCILMVAFVSLALLAAFGYSPYIDGP
jgi:hypothetical protein